MEIRELKTFVTAAEYMNFSKAAEKLGYTQASVTLQIQHLEKELSVCLFDRIGKKVYLTDKGTLLLEHAQILIRNIESLTTKLQDNTASRESNPLLTTIHQDASLRAKTAIECLEAMRDGFDCETEIVLPVELIKRESTGKL